MIILGFTFYKLKRKKKKISGFSPTIPGHPAISVRKRREGWGS